MNQTKHPTNTFNRLESRNNKNLPIEIKNKWTRHVFRIWYGMEMEEKDERTKHLCGWSKGSDSRHLEGEWTPRWVKNVAIWELSKTHKIRLGEGEQVSQNLTQFEKSTFTSKFNVSLQEPNTSIYSVEGWSFKRQKWEGAKEKAFRNAAPNKSQTL